MHRRGGGGGAHVSSTASSAKETAMQQEPAISPTFQANSTQRTQAFWDMGLHSPECCEAMVSLVLVTEEPRGGRTPPQQCPAQSQGSQGPANRRFKLEVL